MANYHLSIKHVSRSTGRSAVSAAAYRSREKLYDERQGITFDYTKKKDLAYAEMILPENAPERWKDRGTLWNEVERSEKRKDSRLSREVEVALPKELNLDQQIALVREYVQTQFVDKGMAADICIHEKAKNPHAHIMLTLREITEEGFGKKVRSWDDKFNIYTWREQWAIVQNRHLLQAGYDIQVDHRSYADREIDLEPQIKIGIAANAYLRDTSTCKIPVDLNASKSTRGYAEKTETGSSTIPGRPSNMWDTMMQYSNGKTSWTLPSGTALMQISSTVFSLPLRTAKSLSGSGKTRREKTCSVLALC